MSTAEEGAAAYAAHEQAMQAGRAEAERVMAEHAAAGTLYPGVTVAGVDKAALTQAFRDIAAERRGDPAADAAVQGAMAALAQLRPADREAIRRLLNESADDAPPGDVPAPPPPPGIQGMSWRDLLVRIGGESRFAGEGDVAWLERPVRVVMPGWVTLLKDAEYDTVTGAFTLEPWLVAEAAVAGTPPAGSRGVPGGD